MMEYIGVMEILTAFVLPPIGVILSVIWYFRHRAEDREA